MERNPEMFIKDVALMVGYKDQFYFSRIFRAVTGISPSEYPRGLCDKEQFLCENVNALPKTRGGNGLYHFCQGLTSHFHGVKNF